MKKFLYIHSILFTLLGLSSCQPKPLTIDVEQLEPSPVVFSQVVPQQLMIVALTQTIGALDFNENELDTFSQDQTQDLIQQLILDGARVTISYAGVTDTLTEIPSGSVNGTGLYLSATTPQIPNEVYTLDIYTTEGNHITATALMLPQVTFNEITPIVERTADNTTVKIAYEIIDPPATNWYMINSYAKVERGTGTLDVNDFITTNSNVLKSTELLSDQLFTQTNFRDTFEIFNVLPTDTIIVSISNISKEYYDYLVLRKKSTNWFSELTKEPINYPTNVVGGYGFFLTHFPDPRVFDLNNY